MITLEQPIITNEPWMDWEPGEGDVVWASEGLAYFAPRWHHPCFLSVFATREDAFAAHDPLCQLRTWPLTVDQAKKEAAMIGRTAVVLRDRDGNELDRWPV